MGYANNTINVRRGLPKGLTALILTAVIIGAAWVPTSALAASIGCGQCHGTAPLSSSPSEQATGHRTGYESTPSYEDTKTPVDPDICNNQGRGLHGIHMNYSSESYGKKGTTTRGNCNYCHNTHIHLNGFVEFSGYSPVSALNSIASSTLANGGTGWTAGDVNNTYVVVSGGDGNAQAQITGVSGGAVTSYSMGAHGHSKGSGYSITSGVTATEVNGSRTFTINITALGNVGLRQAVSSAPVKFSGTGMGANGLDMDQMDGTGTCTTACHKGTSAANPAPWGNYTSVSVVLSCNSCHDDFTELGANLSGMHNKHITALEATDNGICGGCHPDNTGEGRAADDFGSKAYPHASDGTVVKSQNATVTSSNFTFTPAGAGGTAGTCTFTDGIGCHGDGNTTPPWDGSNPSQSGCAACHNYPTYRNWTGYNGHTVMYDLPAGNSHLAATGYNKDTDTYAGVTGPGGKCNMCHSNGTHYSGTIDVVGNGKGYCSGDFTVNQLGDRNANCDNAKCHSGKTTPNWW